MRNTLPLILCLVFLSGCGHNTKFTPGTHDLLFSHLPSVWDEAIPLGNGYTGALVWQKDGRLRISLDHSSLWDLRPMENIGREEWSYIWVYDQWRNNNYGAVQKLFDEPYDRLAAPTKIPAAALEFDLSGNDTPEAVWLDISEAICYIRWKNGCLLELFTDASGNRGWYRFTDDNNHRVPKLVPPSYSGSQQENSDADLFTYDLGRLGYEQGPVTTGENSAVYRQEGWGDFSYTVKVEWENSRGSSTGWWTIIADSDTAGSEVTDDGGKTLYRQFLAARRSHISWWDRFWSASSITLPDSILERQWYLEMYKFGSAARADAPPISLQAVWTADNDRLPPWKGDFHHDLNTQLSYWPAYSSNHTDLAAGFTNWLWDRREVFIRYTRQYFGTDGLNVPGVSTLDGEPMGGWIQYSFGPTVSAWLAHHFYLQWKYTADSTFLRDRAYPWLSSVALHLEGLSVKDERGLRRFPMSSSPEFFDNSREAWFAAITNFDLSLIRWTYLKTAEMAGALGLHEDRQKWLNMLEEWPDLAADDQTGLVIAPGFPYVGSHRHFSHLMSIHPLGLIDDRKSFQDSIIIRRSTDNLVGVGSDYWTGYSYSWLGNILARSHRGDEAADALKTFAECFCLPNSFHVNGDQSGTGRSKFTYRPFTLEGNFAFAAGIQEMLLQSHRGYIEVFPAVPAGWKDISFSTLRAEGAVLVSAVMKEGAVTEVRLVPGNSGTLSLLSPFAGNTVNASVPIITDSGIIQIKTSPGQEIILKPAKEK